MCEFSKKLIAWLDRELPVEEALEVELHLDGCSECRRDLRTYERLSSAFDAYCDAAMELTAPRSHPSWKPAVLGAGAVAAVLALLLASARMRKTQSPTSATFAAAPAPASQLIAETPRAPLNSVMQNPRWHARDLASIATEKKGNPSAKNTLRFTENVPREPNDDTLNVRPTPATAGWQLAEPAIQITIPAEAVLPPGAAPEGISFVAEVSIAPDGSTHQILLQP